MQAEMKPEPNMVLGLNKPNRNELEDIRNWVNDSYGLVEIDSILRIHDLLSLGNVHEILKKNISDAAGQPYEMVIRKWNRMWGDDRRRICAAVVGTVDGFFMKVAQEIEWMERTDKLKEEIYKEVEEKYHLQKKEE